MIGKTLCCIGFWDGERQGWGDASSGWLEHTPKFFRVRWVWDDNIYIIHNATLLNSEKSLAIKKGPSDIPLLAARHEKNAV